MDIRSLIKLQIENNAFVIAEFRQNPSQSVLHNLSFKSKTKYASVENCPVKFFDPKLDQEIVYGLFDQ